MDDTKVSRLFEIIESFQNQVTKTGSIPTETIEKVENILGVSFPEDYRLFLNRYGAITIEDICIYGISFPVNEPPSIVRALKDLWQIAPDIPKNLVPIQFLKEARAIVFIKCNGMNSSDNNTSIVQWDLDSEPNDQNIIPISQSFTGYLSKVLISEKHLKTSIRTLESHVQKFEKEYLSTGKLPRNHIWRPYRFCSQDVVLGLTVVRHSVDNNCLEVDVCMTSDIMEFEEGSGAKVTTSFLLSEAYKCGGSMEIRFSDNVENHHVPLAICELANRYGVILEHVPEGRIVPEEAKNLYMAITEFKPKLKAHIEELANKGNLSKERACYVVHHSLWTQSELEHLILGSKRVDKILGGEAQPEQRLLYQNDIFHARAAIMGGFLDRKLAKKDRSDGQVAVDLEDDVRPIEISFEPALYAKLYSCTEPFPIPWSLEDEDISVNPDDNFVVFLRAREVEDQTKNLMNDLSVIRKMKLSLQAQNMTFHFGCLVPRDFEDLPLETQNELGTYAQSEGIYLLICPETTVALDTEANRRLVSSRIMRE